MFDFDLNIRSREGVIFSGKVVSVTSFNKKGRFDILPTHANFISLIQNKIIIRMVDSTSKEISITNALMRVKNDKVEVYVGIESFANNEVRTQQKLISKE